MESLADIIKIVFDKIHLSSRYPEPLFAEETRINREIVIQRPEAEKAKLKIEVKVNKMTKRRDDIA